MIRNVLALFLAFLLSGCVQGGPAPTVTVTVTPTTGPASTVDSGLAYEPPLFEYRLDETRDLLEVTSVDAGADWFRLEVFAISTEIQFRLNAEKNSGGIFEQGAHNVYRYGPRPMQVGDTLSFCFVNPPGSNNPNAVLSAFVRDRPTGLALANVGLEQVDRECYQAPGSALPRPPQMALSSSESDDRLHVASASLTTWDAFQIRATQPVRMALDAEATASATSVSKSYSTFPWARAVSAGSFIDLCRDGPEGPARVLVARVADGVVFDVFEFRAVPSCG